MGLAAQACGHAQGCAVPAAPTGVKASILYSGHAHRRIPLPTALVDRPAVEKINLASSLARTDHLRTIQLFELIERRRSSSPVSSQHAPVRFGSSEL